MPSADVYKDGRLAATLTKELGSVTFDYLPGYSGPPVASTLPVTTTPVILAGGAVPPFFAGLLPEGRRLSSLRRNVKASLDDEFALLLAIGGDTIGDVQVFPTGQPPHEPAPLLTVPADPSEADFGELLARDGLVDAVGLPGVQDKASGKLISVPATWSGSPYIIKFSPPEYEHLVENEAFFLDLARSAGMAVSDHRVIHDKHDVSALVLRRFDRDAEGARLAFEDATQVLGLWPAAKYDVTAEEAATALIGLCAAPKVAARELFRQVAFAVITGNNDQHAKNLGVLRTRSGEWRISPAYDMPSTLPYGDLRFALPVQGRYEQLSRKALLRFASTIGLPSRLAERDLDRLLANTERPLAEMTASGLPFDENRLRQLGRQLAARRRSLVRG